MGQNGGEPIVSSSDEISLYFKTRQPNGVLFYTGNPIYFHHRAPYRNSKNLNLSTARKTVKRHLIGLPVPSVQIVRLRREMTSVV